MLTALTQTTFSLPDIYALCMLISVPDLQALTILCWSTVSHLSATTLTIWNVHSETKPGTALQRLASRIYCTLIRRTVGPLLILRCKNHNF